MMNTARPTAEVAHAVTSSSSVEGSDWAFWEICSLALSEPWLRVMFSARQPFSLLRSEFSNSFPSSAASEGQPEKGQRQLALSLV